MVNDVILSQPILGKDIGLPSANRSIAGGPLYGEEDVLVACKSVRVSVLTRKATGNIQDLCFTEDDIAELIQRAVQIGRYKNSEWCETGRTATARSWVACDAYSVSRDEWNEAAGKSFLTEYYVKFGIGKTGLVLLVVSCHL